MCKRVAFTGKGWKKRNKKRPLTPRFPIRVLDSHSSSIRAHYCEFTNNNNNTRDTRLLCTNTAVFCCSTTPVDRTLLRSPGGCIHYAVWYKGTLLFRARQRECNLHPTRGRGKTEKNNTELGSMFQVNFLLTKVVYVIHLKYRWSRKDVIEGRKV